MRIAFNCRLLYRNTDIQNRYAASLLGSWLQYRNDGELLLLQDTAGVPFPFPLQEAAVANVAPAQVSAFATWYWYNLRLPGLLKKQKAAFYIGCDGHTSLVTRVPQLLLLPRIASLPYRRLFTGKEALQLSARPLKRAVHLVVASAFARQQLVEQYRIAAHRVSVVHAAPEKQFVPLSWPAKEKTKAEFAGGSEYFICYGTLYPFRNMGVLLKAFSGFKKWQKSGMKLLLVGDVPARHNEELDQLDTYKYRQDVVLLPRQPAGILARLVAAAYAVVMPSSYEDIGLQALEAMACEVPVIAASAAALPELCGEAALYALPGDVEDTARQMIRLYKEEDFRTQLIEKGRRQMALYGWQEAAGKLDAIIRNLTSV